MKTWEEQARGAMFFVLKICTFILVGMGLVLLERMLT